MKDPLSLQAITNNQYRNDLHKLPSVPPGCQQHSIAGLLSLHLHIQYLNRPNSTLFFRTKLWGNEIETLTFSSLNDREAVLHLNIRSNIEKLSKYLADMGVLCIECLAGRELGREGDLKPFGWVYINLKRYVINFTMSNFEETVNIVDLKKAKLGEVIAKLKMEIYPKDPLYPNPTQHVVKPERQVSVVAEKEGKQQLPPKLSQIRANVNVLKESRSDTPQSSNMQHSIDQFQEEVRVKVARKGKAQMFLDDYYKTKPQHTQLSLLREKYGFNCPSIEVMKLKLDEAMLLSQPQQGEDNTNTNTNSNVHLLLKYIRNEAKVKIDTLLVTCLQSQVKTETKIQMGQQSNTRIEVNYLYVLPKGRGEDRLAFEVKDGRAEVSVGELRQRSSIDLKGKNGKRVAVLQFAVISQKNLQSKPAQQKREGKEGRVGESCLVRVEGWGAERVQLKNKKIGVVYGGKLMYEPECDDNLFVEVVLQSSEGQPHRLNVHVNHLYKEENYLLSGRQVKIISAKGKLNDIIAFASSPPSTSPIDNHNPNTNDKGPHLQPQGRERVDLRELGGLFQKLQGCSNEECSQLMQLCASKGASPRQIARLSQLIQVQPGVFQSILREQFLMDFTRFLKCFMVYHRWDHRYRASLKRVQRLVGGGCQRELLKSIRRIKRSSEVLFGTVPTSVFLSEVLLGVGEQSQGDFSREDLCKLIALLLQRYPTHSIKLSQLQSFLTGQADCYHLNAYQLTKMAQEITSNVEFFGEELTEADWQLIDLFRRDCEGEWGLAKLLLANHQELTESSMGQSQLNEHKPTEEIPLQTEPAMKTEQEEIRQVQQGVVTEEVERVTVVVSALQGVEGAREMEMVAEGDRVRMADIVLPTAIPLIQESAYTVTIVTLQGQLQGVFVASSRPQRVQLFRRGVQAGAMRLFGQMEGSEEQIAVRVQDTHSLPLPIHHQEQQEIEVQQAQARVMIPTAKSPLVKCTIRSLRPTRANFKLLIAGEQERKVINFPNQNEVLLRNCQEWTITMLDEPLEAVVLTNHLASGPYCFIHARDKRVEYTAVIEVEECWDPQLALGVSESLHLLLHFDHLLAVGGFKQGEYSLSTEGGTDIPTVSCDCRGEGVTRLKVGESVQLHRPAQKYSIRLISRQSKQLLAQFAFTLGVIEQGIARCSRSLISKGFRLQVTVYQIRHSWMYCKPSRIVSLFHSESRRVISSWIRANPQVGEERLIAWLRGNTQLSLTEIDIILEELIRENPVRGFLALFEEGEKVGLPYLADIREEFGVFDYNDQGLVSDQQLRIAKKVFSRSFKDFHALLTKHQSMFVPSPQLEGNFIIDLSTAIHPNHFDYLSLLDLVEEGERHPPTVESIVKDEREEGRANLSVRIVEFSNLSLNRLPCTFLFKANGHLLAQPIHKCYSNKYSTSNQVILPRKPTPQLQIYLQTLKSNGLWDHKLLQTLPIAPQVKVFGGVIKFKLQPTDRAQMERREVLDENRDSNSRPQVKSPRESNSKQFVKSIWNKSLNDTKQKWSQWKQSRRITKQQVKRELSDDE